MTTSISSGTQKIYKIYLKNKIIFDAVHGKMFLGSIFSKNLLIKSKYFHEKNFKSPEQMCNLRFGLEGLGRVSWGRCVQVQVHLCEHPGYGVAHYGISYTYKVIKKGISQYYCPIFSP